MLLQNNHSTQADTKVTVRTDKGVFGPYASRALAEHFVTSGTIPFTNPASVTFVEQLADGNSVLLG